MSNIIIVDNNHFKKISVVLLGMILLLGPNIQSVDAVGFSFGSSINISNNSGISQDPQVIVSGTNVFVIWADDTSGNNEILFSKSANSGANFDSSINISQSGAVTSLNPQMDVSGSNILAVWEEGNDVFFDKSTDNGDSFSGSPINLSNTGGTSSTLPKVVASGSDVYVPFQENTEILFSDSSNTGSSFDTPDNLSNSGGTNSQTPQISSSGNNVFVVWREGGDIFFRKSGDNGDNFSSALNLSSSGTTSSIPQITSSGSNVYVVWKEGTDIFFKRSANDGDSFPFGNVDIGDTGSSGVPDPQVAASGSNVYVVWVDKTSGNDEIKFVRSTDNGVNFDTVQNLSNNSDNSVLPQIVASGTNVFVVWRDATPSGGNNDILFVASDDSGQTFGNPKNISQNTGSSNNPQIAISGDNAYIVWEDNTPSNQEVFFITGMVSPITIDFDKTEYKSTESANITILDPNSNLDSGVAETIVATVTSTTDTNDGGSGISITLTEDNVNSGSFDGALTFTTGSTSDASDILKVSPGDTITASFNGETSSALIFSITIDFGFNGLFGIGGYDFGEIAQIRVEDKNANVDTGNIESITVSITSSVAGGQAILQLDETGPDTGIFGGTSTKLMFTEISLLTEGSSIQVTQEDSTANTNPSLIETTTVTVTSSSDNSGITLTLTETQDNSGIFSEILQLNSTGSVPTEQIHAVAGDIVSVSNGDTTSNTLVSPNPDPSTASLLVDFTLSDTVTASYNPSNSASVSDALGPGGGGGGLVRPGLVVNVLAGAAAGGGGGGPPGPTITLRALSLSDSGSEIISMPQEIRDIATNHDPHVPLEPMIDTYEDFDFPLTINGNGFVLGDYENTLVSQTVKRGETIEITLVFYTNSEVAFTSLNFNLGPTRTIAGSDSQLLLYKDKFEIVDPNGNIAFATGSLNNEDDLKRVATFSFTLSETVEWPNPDLVIRSWNDDLNSGDIIVYDAIQVLPSDEEIAFEESLPEPEVEQLKSLYVPIWIKNNAAWWSQELIEDADFVAGIEYLIQNEILTIQDNQVISPSYSSDEIPEWIKNNAGWWSDDLISEKEFIDGLQWLITNGIIQVTET